MDDLLNNSRHLVLIAGLACVVVFIAMAVDLACGVWKAKQRGEARTSYGLKRSIMKFMLYEGSMLIAIGVDLLIHWSNLLRLFHGQAVYGLPVITCAMGIFLCFIEMLSVREKADEKTNKSISKMEKIAAGMISKDDLKAMLKEAAENINEKTNQTEEKQ